MGIAIATSGAHAVACSASHPPASSESQDSSAPPGEIQDAGATDGAVAVVPSDAGGCIGADAGVLPLTSDDKPISFVVAAPDPASGDWMGDGDYVAQVFNAADGSWKANLLHAFDMPNASPIVVLSGTPTSCTTMTFAGGGWTATLDSTHFTGQNGSESFDLKHVARVSPTLGAAAPPGAVVLFDGTGFDAWAEKAGSQWLQAAGPSRWKIVDGAMEVVPGTDSLITKQSFGDATVHVEFRAVGTPTHSGVFLEARYQTTILQNYGVYTGNVTGNFGNESPVINPTIHADRAALEWQTLDIEFQAPRFGAGNAKTANAAAKVTLNGVVIFDHTPLTPPTGAAGRMAEAPTGPLLLEYHGMPVQYRNIWVLPSAP
jgi:hypothetical protein